MPQSLSTRRQKTPSSKRVETRPVQVSWRSWPGHEFSLCLFLVCVCPACWARKQWPTSVELLGQRGGGTVLWAPILLHITPILWQIHEVGAGTTWDGGPPGRWGGPYHVIQNWGWGCWEARGASQKKCPSAPIIYTTCVSEMFVTSYSVTCCIFIPGKPGIWFHYFCAVYDECK